jgi:hypothetical protein
MSNVSQLPFPFMDHFLIVLMQSSPLLNSFPQLRNNLAWVFGAKHCAASNDNVCTSLSGSVDCVLGKTAVDFDIELGVAFAQSLDLGHHLGHEFLAAETGLDGHYEDHL